MNRAKETTNGIFSRLVGEHGEDGSLANVGEIREAKVI
jgi:hypothetical protein